MQLQGRVAIVTGAGGGLGRTHAFYLARQGARIVVNDLDTSAAERVAAEIVAVGGEALAAAASVTDEDAVAAMVAEAMGRWGRIDILVNNAGILRDKSFAKLEPRRFPPRGRRPPHWRRNLHQGGLGDHAPAGLWPDRDDDLLLRALGQFRPGQLRRGEDGAGRADADAGDRGREIWHQGQLPRPDRGDANDRGRALRRRASPRSIRPWSAPACSPWSARRRRPASFSAPAPAISRPRASPFRRAPISARATRPARR